jgi:hypothetical protein
MNHVGVVSHARLPELPSLLKRYALFFDQIRIVGVGPENLARMDRFVGPDRMAELVYLYEAGILAEGKITAHSLKGVASEDSRKIIENALQLLVAERQLDQVDDITGLLQLLMEEINSSVQRGEDTRPLIEAYNALAKALAECVVEGTYALPLSARQVALDLTVYENVQAACIEELDYRSAGDAPHRSADADTIYEIAVEGIPMLEESAWQDILAFKASPEARQRLLAFHIWVSELAKGGLSYAEAQEKLTYLKQEYVDAISRAKLQWRRSMLRCFVVAVPAALESMVKLKFKEMAEAPFKLAEIRTELKKAETEAPGRELAYIVRASEELDD